MTTESNKSTARRFLESFDRGDWDFMLATLAPGMTSQVAGDPRVMDAEGYRAMAEMFARAFSQSRHMIEAQLAEGDWVATRLTWTALHTGDFMGIPASGRPVRMEAVVHDRFLGGKILEHRAVMDLFSLMSQIGAIPAAA